MSGLSRSLLRLGRVLSSVPRKLVLQPLTKRAFSQCGARFHLGERNDFRGVQNIHVGNDVSFGPDTRIWTVGAHVYIGDDVMFGPGVTIISGDHRIDLEGKPMREVLPSEKLAENDQDVVIEDDVWIGSNVTVLKGVHIPRGSVIAAGAVVTRSLDDDNCIWGGMPARLIGRRFHD